MSLRHRAVDWSNRAKMQEPYRYGFFRENARASEKEI